MEIPKILRDESNTKIINIEDVINGINNNDDVSYLFSYYNVLDSQQKVSMEEVKPLMDSVFNRILSLVIYSVNSYLTLSDTSDKVKKTFKVFLDYSISNMENGLTNRLEYQNIFDKFIKAYKENKISKIDEEFYNELTKIVYRYDDIINKIDSDQDYLENNYLTRTKVLNLSNVNGHNLTEEDKVKTGGFVVTLVILESTLVLSLICGLLMLFR